MAITISDQNQLFDYLEIELSALSAKVGDDQKLQATEKALMELRWDYPITDSFKAYWTLERSKRHAIYVLLIESADKFKYKQINLNHRFDHYQKLIEIMDKEFMLAIEENPMVFPGVDIGDRGITDYIPGGFEYDFTGKDVTPDTISISGDEGDA